MKESVLLKTFRSVLQMFPAGQKKKFWFMMLLVLFTSIVDLVGLALFIPVLSAIADPSLLSGDTILAKIKNFAGIADDTQFLLVFFLAAFIFLIFRTAFIVFSQLVQAKFVFKLSEYIGEAVYGHYLFSPYERFSKLDSAKVIRELTIGPQHFSRFLVMPLLIIAAEFFIIITIVVGIAIYNIQVFLMLLLTIFPAISIFQMIVKKRLHRYGQMQHEYTPRFYSNSNRGIQGFVDVKLRNKESILISDYLSIFKILNRVNSRTSVLGIIPSKLFELVTVAGLLLIFIYGIYWVGDPTLVLPLITLYAAAGYRVIPSLSKIMPSLMQLEQYNYLFGIYGDILRARRKKPPIENLKISPVAFEREIAIRDVSFKFSNTDSYLFQDLSIQFKRGEIVGLIGKSGSGKTTLVKVLTGFYTPTSGEILIDGEKLTLEKLPSWRSHISYVQQSPYLEKGSLASNIAFLEHQIDQGKLKEAIAGASLSEFVMNKNPHEILIEEAGKNLSGGQKQRVIIARALYHKSKLIVLDEATSALDNETEEDINQTIEKLKGTGITIVIIAHRYSTLKHTDRIIQMEAGRISGELTYNSIINK